jgi:hypothetical protein
MSHFFDGQHRENPMPTPKAPVLRKKTLAATGVASAVNLTGGKLQLLPATDSPASAARTLRDLRLIAESMAALGMALPADIAGFGLGKPGSLTDIPGLSTGRAGQGRRIGGQHGASGGAGKNDSLGFDDPLDGHRNNSPGRKLVGPGRMPGKGDLVGQDTDYSNGSASSHGQVWAERHTSRQSADGTQTWGSTSYRDYSNNHWRVDYHDERRPDGSIHSTDTVYDGNNEPIKTTVREGNPDGTATETTTTHATGEVKTTVGTLPEIFPDRSQTGEGVERGGPSLAPRGWSNPISGVVHNGGLATGNNQVNPGRESQPQAATPLKIDLRILVVNPSPDLPGHGDPRPRDIPRDGETIIDPPRPPF